MGEKIGGSRESVKSPKRVGELGVKCKKIFFFEKWFRCLKRGLRLKIGGLESVFRG